MAAVAVAVAVTVGATGVGKTSAYHDAIKRNGPASFGKRGYFFHSVERKSFGSITLQL